MALYRPASRRPLAIAGVAGLVFGLIGGFLAGQATAPGLEASIDGLRDRTAAVRTSLEVLRIEYPKLLVAGSDSGGALAALERAEQGFDRLEVELALIDPDASDGAYRALRELRRVVDARGPEAEADAAIDEVNAQLDLALPQVFGR
ncbi:MAG TPA: hypothetical protein VNT28_01865 [Candidatus Limnocylindrales bacterium]|jgi:hypothetical protein|nr:hypothetical protein [Candidatus Limnocylindrales bacterium]